MVREVRRPVRPPFEAAPGPIWCQEKHLPDGLQPRHSIVVEAASPIFRYVRNPSAIQERAVQHRDNSRKLNSKFGTANVPTIDLSEPQGLSLFPALRGGIETVRVLWTESVDNKLVRSSPSIRAVSRFVGHACSAGRGLENGSGVALSFLESNVSPFPLCQCR